MKRQGKVGRRNAVSDEQCLSGQWPESVIGRTEAESTFNIGADYDKWSGRSAAERTRA